MRSRRERAARTLARLALEPGAVAVGIFVTRFERQSGPEKHDHGPARFVAHIEHRVIFNRDDALRPCAKVERRHHEERRPGGMASLE